MRARFRTDPHRRRSTMRARFRTDPASQAEHHAGTVPHRPASQAEQHLRKVSPGDTLGMAVLDTKLPSAG
jgi:hypothetical protein